MARTAEGVVKDDIKKFLHSWGFIRAGSKKSSWPENPRGWYYMPVSNGFGVHGIPDFVGVFMGHSVFIEAKKPRGETTPNQDFRMEEIRIAKGKCFVIDGDVSLLETWLQEVSK